MYFLLPMKKDIPSQWKGNRKLLDGKFIKYTVNSIHDTSEVQSSTGNPSIDAIRETCQL